jgi:hypothetical protein
MLHGMPVWERTMAYLPALELLAKHKILEEWINIRCGENHRTRQADIQSSANGSVGPEKRMPILLLAYTPTRRSENPPSTKHALSHVQNITTLSILNCTNVGDAEVGYCT